MAKTAWAISAWAISADSYVVSTLMVDDSTSGGTEILPPYSLKWLCSHAVSQWHSNLFQCWRLMVIARMPWRYHLCITRNDQVNRLYLNGILSCLFVDVRWYQLRCYGDAASILREMAKTVGRSSAESMLFQYRYLMVVAHVPRRYYLCNAWNDWVTRKDLNGINKISISMCDDSSAEETEMQQPYYLRLLS